MKFWFDTKFIEDGRTMLERVLVDYGPHHNPGETAWEVHIQRGPNHPRYKFHAGCSDEISATAAAADLAKTFRDDTTYVAIDKTRKVVAVKFISA